MTQPDPEAEEDRSFIQAVRFTVHTDLNVAEIEDQTVFAVGHDIHNFRNRTIVTVDNTVPDITPDGIIEFLGDRIFVSIGMDEALVAQPIRHDAAQSRYGQAVGDDFGGNQLIVSKQTVGTAVCRCRGIVNFLAVDVCGAVDHVDAVDEVAIQVFLIADHAGDVQRNTVTGIDLVTFIDIIFADQVAVVIVFDADILSEVCTVAVFAGHIEDLGLTFDAGAEAGFADQQVLFRHISDFTGRYRGRYGHGSTVDPDSRFEAGEADLSLLFDDEVA